MEIDCLNTEYTIKKTFEGQFVIYNKSLKSKQLFNRIGLACEYIKNEIIKNFNFDWLCLFYYSYNPNETGKYLTAEFILK